MDDSAQSTLTSGTLPSCILGKNHKTWKIREAMKILNHYGVQTQSHESKTQLLLKINDLEKTGKVTIKNRKRILNALPSQLSLAEPNIRSTCSKGQSRSRENVRADEEARSLPAESAASGVSGNLDRQVAKMECIVCFEVLGTDHALQGRITDDCTHHSEICKACLARYLTVQAENGISDRMECPTCNSRFDHSHVKQYAPHDTFERYDTLRTREVLSKLPNFRKCLNPACSAGQIHENAHDQPIVTCFDCGHKSCFTHDIPWHEGYTCHQIEREQNVTDMGQDDVTRQLEIEMEEDVATHKSCVNANTKRCPNEECACLVQKDGGCQHMRCSLCEHQYCWDCLASWDLIALEGNHHHLVDCPWHSDNLPSVSSSLVAQLERAIFETPLTPLAIQDFGESLNEDDLVPSNFRVQIKDEESKRPQSAMAEDLGTSQKPVPRSQKRALRADQQYPGIESPKRSKKTRDGH